jgi:Na+/phosphate symporter
LCWKDEWEAAVKNLKWAIIHIQRAQDSLEKRALRNRKTLHRLKYPSERKRVEELLKKNTEAVEKCSIMIETLRKYQAALINLIETHGVSRKPRPKP